MEDQPLVVTQRLQPALDITGVLQPCRETAVRAGEGRAHLGDQFLEGVGINAMPLPQWPMTAARCAGPVRQLMQCRAVVIRSCGEPRSGRQLDHVGTGPVVRLIAAVLDARTGVVKQCFGGDWCYLTSAMVSLVEPALKLALRGA